MLEPVTHACPFPRAQADAAGKRQACPAANAEVCSPSAYKYAHSLHARRAQRGGLGPRSAAGDEQRLARPSFLSYF